MLRLIDNFDLYSSIIEQMINEDYESFFKALLFNENCWVDKSDLDNLYKHFLEADDMLLLSKELYCN